MKVTNNVAQEPKAKRPAASPKKDTTGAGTKGGGSGEKSQRERFIETARAVGVDETGEEFMKLLKKVVPPKRPKSAR